MNLSQNGFTQFKIQTRDIEFKDGLSGLLRILREFLNEQLADQQEAIGYLHITLEEYRKYATQK